MTQRLADDSVLRLNTDTAVTIRYGRDSRIVRVERGEAVFEVTHDPKRPFTVLAGPARVTAVGTRFDVYLVQGATTVTVMQGAVSVAPVAQAAGAAVQVDAGEQVRLTGTRWTSLPAAVDSARATAWLNKQIVFDHDPLERVTAEINRYAPKPIEIVTPDLRSLEISGSFATDDIDGFLAFLRSLDRVRVEVGERRIRILRD
jgi:transmembrane sensor